MVPVMRAGVKVFTALAFAAAVLGVLAVSLVLDLLLTRRSSRRGGFGVTK